MALFKTFLAKMRGETSSIGVDVGHKSVKAVKIFHGSKKSKLIDRVEIPLDEGVLVDGEINQPEVLGGKILDVLDLLKFDKSFDDIYFSISWSSGILADRVNLKFPKGSDEEEVILFEAGNRPPFDEKDITLDYQILHEEEGKENKEVLLVAAKNALLQKWARFLDTYDIHPIAFDVDAFSIYNTFLHTCKEEDNSKAVGLLNVGHQRASISFVVDGNYHSTRVISGSVVQDMVKSLARKLNINSSDAMEMLFGKVTLTSQAENAIQSMIVDLARGVQQANQFFQSTSKGRTLDKLVLSGGGSFIVNTETILSSELNEMEIELMDFLPSEGEEVPQGPIYAVAYGLAMRNG